MLQNLSGKEIAVFCNIIICSNEKFWLLFKLFNKITFEIMKPIYIPSFINALQYSFAVEVSKKLLTW